MRIGVVAIGRNEGQRLVACLRSALRDAKTVVCVDSGSTDGSAATAREMGAHVVALDMSIPFTAARARNEGLARLLQVDPSVELVQYVDGDCEIVTLDSEREGQGLGTKLIDAVIEEARNHNCKRVFLITTNDNLKALGFYQKRGFELVRINRGAVNESRKIKPGIPLIGMNNIPLRDEIELEIVLK